MRAEHVGLLHQKRSSEAQEQGLGEEKRREGMVGRVEQQAWNDQFHVPGKSVLGSLHVPVPLDPNLPSLLCFVAMLGTEQTGLTALAVP